MGVGDLRHAPAALPPTKKIIIIIIIIFNTQSTAE
jgi:hypothetical protein